MCSLEKMYIVKQSDVSGKAFLNSFMNFKLNISMYNTEFSASCFCFKTNKILANYQFIVEIF